MQSRKRDTEVQNRLLDSVGEAEGGMFQKNSIETCILSMVKQITSPGGMHETSARAWCTGKTQRNWVESEVGGGIGMGNTCNSMADSCQCMTKPTEMLWISLQLININEKKKEHISGTRNLKKKKRRRIAQVPYEVAVVQSLVLSYISPSLGTQRDHISKPTIFRWGHVTQACQ